jgi:hypothetical protein
MGANIAIAFLALVSVFLYSYLSLMRQHIRLQSLLNEVNVKENRVKTDKYLIKSYESSIELIDLENSKTIDIASTNFNQIKIIEYNKYDNTIKVRGSMEKELVFQIEDDKIKELEYISTF